MAQDGTDPASWATYQAFGLRLRSEIDLPELARADPAGEAEAVEIAWGRAPLTLADAVEVEPFIHVAGQDCLIDAPTARLLVSRGRRIIIDPKLDVDPAEIRPFLLGSAFAVLCHQRQILPLHASALALADGAIAFAGPSGAGKSTLAAQAAQAGAWVVADDLCAVTAEAGSPVAHAGVTRLKLAADAVALIGRDVGALEPVAQSRPRFALPLGEGRPTGPWPLQRVYLLDSVEGSALPLSLTGAAAVSAIIGAVQRWPAARAMGAAPFVFSLATTIARACSIARLARTPEGSAPYARLRAVLTSGD